MIDAFSGSLISILSNLIVGALIAGGMYVVYRLSINLARRRAGFTDRDLRTAGLNHDQRRAFHARRKRQKSIKSPFHSARKRRARSRK